MQPMWLPLQLVSVFCWATVNVLDSVLVQHYEKKPSVLQWHQSFYTSAALVVLALLFPIQTSWWPALMAAGFTGYLGDRLFFHVIDRVDVSVTNITWAMLSIFLSVGGMVFFGERWTLWQGSGVVLVVAGILMLSLWGKHVGSWKNFLMLVLLAVLYAPFYLTQKYAIASGVGVLTSFIWLLFGREVFSAILPLFSTTLRSQAFAAFRHNASFPLLNAAVVAFFFGGTYLTAMAYQSGPISLVSIVSNVQPFVTLFLAWVLWMLLPRSASRELLTVEAVGVKIAAFLVVLGGLALLALHP
ncbi:hypothetical protein EXS70_04550 [Candidatus Peribacteria bacterium]|nr:hypothetical protein [Candidatus Peribacteria bacterium]